mmetsp:Transcript_12950/g.30718  ORF Transcript_12950/g.30718 Transcript_12950/m.30718 type:complete len:280 (-) Transcript_12950:301-1140(-)
MDNPGNPLIGRPPRSEADGRSQNWAPLDESVGCWTGCEADRRPRSPSPSAGQSIGSARAAQEPLRERGPPPGWARSARPSKLVWMWTWMCSASGSGPSRLVSPGPTLRLRAHETLRVGEAPDGLSTEYSGCARSCSGAAQRVSSPRASGQVGRSPASSPPAPTEAARASSATRPAASLSTASCAAADTERRGGSAVVPYSPEKMGSKGGRCHSSASWLTGPRRGDPLGSRPPSPTAALPMPGVSGPGEWPSSEDRAWGEAPLACAPWSSASNTHPGLMA